MHQSPHDCLNFLCPLSLVYPMFLSTPGAREFPQRSSSSASPLLKLYAVLLATPPNFSEPHKRGHLQSTGPSQSACQGYTPMSSGTVILFTYPSTSQAKLGLFPAKSCSPFSYLHNSTPVPTQSPFLSFLYLPKKLVRANQHRGPPKLLRDVGSTYLLDLQNVLHPLWASSAKYSG